MTDDQEARERLAASLRLAMPIEQPLSDYVTRIELADAMRHVETKIANSELRQRNWVLGGCLAIIVAFGGGYISLVGKLDRLNEAMPIVNQVLDGRREWMLRQDQRDDKQDRALEGVSKDYTPLPYANPPR